MKKVAFYILFTVMLMPALRSFGQGKFGMGLALQPTLCFTDLSPRLDGLQRTSPRHWDLFNYEVGYSVDYQFDYGLAIATGVNFGRKRYGFIHEQQNDGGDVRLWGHSEFYSLHVPLNFSYVVYTGRDPFYELSPFAGISVGKNFVSYRNLTRMDENNSYIYRLDNTDFESQSNLVTLQAGIQLRTTIEQLGLIYWQLTLGRDLTQLPVFSYQIISSEGTQNIEQHLSMNYISFRMTFYFKAWDIINGQFKRRV